MNLRFSKIGRGPGWERWVILEDQHGDSAFAGEAILTYSDYSTYADLECDILFTRQLSDEETEDLLDAVTSILSGRGNVTVFAVEEIVTKGFDMLQQDTEEE
jgi:hypothetical protein